VIQRALVMGASGFLGSHVTRHLVEQGHDVRVMLRESSVTVGIDDLDVERVYGAITDLDAVRAAMADRDVVYYCVVDTRAWLRDPAPLFATNVDALRGVLDVAVEADLTKFVFTSSVATLARNDSRLVTEDDPQNWADLGGAYVASRIEAERLVLDYARQRGLPGVAMCVGTTYGTGDHQPTPHGMLLEMSTRGLVPWYVPTGAALVVGIRSAAHAMVLAGERGRPGERYAISERLMSQKQVHDIGCVARGRPRAWLPLPYSLMWVLCVVFEAGAWVLRRDALANRTSLRLMCIFTEVDTTKARTELGWEPIPIETEIGEAVAFYAAQRS
jgi:dihydroflavonol-4-reductase